MSESNYKTWSIALLKGGLVDVCWDVTCVLTMLAELPAEHVPGPPPLASGVRHGD